MTRATRSAGALCADCGTGATGVVPNPFAGRASERQLPDARVAMRGTRDLGKQAVAAEGRQVHMRRFLTALGPNPAEDDRPRWTFVDSMARPLGVPEKRGDRWDVLDLTAAGGSMETPGSIPSSWPSRGVHAWSPTSSRRRVRPSSSTRTTRVASSRVPFGIAGFIPRAALPPRWPGAAFVARSTDTTRAAAARRSPFSPPRLCRAPGSVSEDDFLGEDAKERTYATYNANPPYADARYVM